MIDGLKPYPAYKDSGVPWLGQVPEHWEVWKIRDVAQVVNGYPFDSARFSQSIGFPLIRIRDLNKTRTAVRYDGPFIESARVNHGDVLIGMDGDFNVGIWRGSEPALLNQRMCCVRGANATTERFLAYLLPLPLKEINDVTWSTTVKHLASAQLERIKFASPPLPEQTAIVRFLDYMDRRIRRVIHARQRQIKLLEEYRQALIHQTVTGQIDVRTGKPYPAYKESGVPWLGQVPEHWETISLKRVARIRSGDAIPTDKVQSVKTETACIQVIGGNGLLGFTQTANTTGGVIVIGRVGALCGNVHEIREPVWVTDNALVLWLRREAFALTYLAAVLRARNLNEIADKTAQPLITGTRVIAQIVPLPPLPEQTAIVEYLDAQTAKIDAAIAALRREIELLREYRERLIADVVTGKVDVREVAAQLPEEAPEEEAEWVDMDEIGEGEAADEESGAEALPEEVES